jgi:hypothetical protein
LWIFSEKTIHLISRNGESIIKIGNTSKTTNVARATCTPFLIKFKNDNFKFLKNLKLNLDMDNVEIYKRAKFQLKISSNAGCARTTNLTYVIVKSVNFYNL